MGKIHFYDLTPEAERESLKAMAFEAFKYRERFVGLENPIQTKDGRVVWVSTNGIPMLNADGTLRGYQGSDTDITERKRAQEALREASRKLNLLSSITRHDINNQLMALEGNLTLLKMKQLEHSSDEHLLKVEAAAERISAMIRFTKEYEDIGVHAPIWQDVMALVRTASGDIPFEKARVVNDVPAGTEVFADPLIAKVFHNLIGNAVRYGGNITTIHFSVEERDGVHAIVCEDDGVGISADMKEKLFTHGFGKNHGLGLFLSREILSITGITITEAGALGRGAKFVITIPAGGFRGPKADGS